MTLQARLLGGGSSARRGQTPWTDPAPWRTVLEQLGPAHVAHGASPSGGADKVIDEVSTTYFREHGLDPQQHVHPFPVDTIDGPWPGAGPNRNAREVEVFRPHLAALLVVGRVGEVVGTKGRYLSNGSEDMARCLRAAKVPLIVYREDGVEPYRDGPAALAALRLLYGRTRAPELVDVGRAVAAFVECGDDGPKLEEVLAALACARESSRFGPWLAPIEATLALSHQRG